MMERATVEELVNKYDVDSAVALKAFENLDNFKVFSVAFSGKIGSGKDTVGLKFAESLLTHENEKLNHMHFATPLKNEMTQLISIIKSSESFKNAVYSVSEVMNISNSDSVHLVEVLFKDVKSGLILDGYSRTFNNRLAIQYLGTEVRRAQDDLYWVRPFVEEVLTCYANEVNIVVTDTRFVNEAVAAFETGISLIRLDVSDEEQYSRILARDGVAMSEDARNHVSETMLDDFENFTIRINTDDYSSPSSVVEGIHSYLANEVLMAPVSMQE